MFEHSRAHFRVQYPPKVRPAFDTDTRSWDVLDVSEGGLRLRVPDGVALELGTELAGEVRFRRGERVPVRGTVIRCVAGHAAVRLDVTIPFRVILEEQRFLLAQNYGLTW